MNTERSYMLTGSLWDKLLLFALPLAASSILQQLFNAVDVAVVGHYGSSQAQAAVGCNGPVINLLLNLFVGISIGTNVVIANYIGQDQSKRKNIQDAVHTSLVVALISGIFLLVLGLAISRPILAALKTPEDVLQQGILYLRIYFLGMPFIMIYNFGASILRSKGDTKRPFYCLLISGIINAALNLLLVIVFHLGVAGVAIATVVSNIVNALMVLCFLFREEESLKVECRKLKITKKELDKILRIGIPAGLQGMVFSVANIFIQVALNKFGSDAVSGSAISLNYEFITYFIISAFNQTAVTFTSQNFGAGEFERCKRIFRICILLSIILTGTLSLTIVINRGFFIRLFTTKQNVAHYASARIVWILTVNCMASTYEIAGAALRGMGNSMLPAVLTVFGTCIFRLWWIWYICRKFTGFVTLLIVYPISWAITGVIVLAAYYLVRSRNFKRARI
ncbi:putative efflux protein, MATE family [[Clostridium] polysaccharolyticum]|uniref:Probable multidrug resistance protein NorM n=2 Tax=[Clostridium] polysaccharolyticum TaxID=29364 RepID=A0A1I0DDE9_9FIRM|nr:putative efflux protein, MATE family [[Clostridium] polysaccharolyticum]